MGQVELFSPRFILEISCPPRSSLPLFFFISLSRIPRHIRTVQAFLSNSPVFLVKVDFLAWPFRLPLEAVTELQKGVGA